MPEEREELDAETKKMKEEILRQIIQMKSIDIEDRQKLCTKINRQSIKSCKRNND